MRVAKFNTRNLSLPRTSVQRVAEGREVTKSEIEDLARGNDPSLRKLFKARAPILLVIFLEN